MWHLHQGNVKPAVTSHQGKEAIVTILDSDEFFGEGCLAGQALRLSTANGVGDCTLNRIENALMVNLFPERHGISELFLTHLLSHNIRFEEDLVDQLLTPPTSAWHGFSYCCRILARKAGPKWSIPESTRNTCPKWSAPPGRGSVISWTNFGRRALSITRKTAR